MVSARIRTGDAAGGRLRWRYARCSVNVSWLVRVRRAGVVLVAGGAAWVHRLMRQQEPGDALLTTRLGLPAVWWYGEISLSDAATARPGAVIALNEFADRSRAAVVDLRLPGSDRNTAFAVSRRPADEPATLAGCVGIRPARPW